MPLTGVLDDCPEGGKSAVNQHIEWCGVPGVRYDTTFFFWYWFCMTGEKRVACCLARGFIEDTNL